MPYQSMHDVVLYLEQEGHQIENFLPSGYKIDGYLLPDETIVYIANCYRQNQSLPPFTIKELLRYVF